MRAVSWNCNGAFRKKFHLLEQFNPELMIIQECEDPARSTKEFADWATNYLWIGENKNKGVGVFSRSKFKVELLDWSNEGLQLFLPCRVSENLNLLAIWTKHANSPNFRYIGQLWKYLQLNKKRIYEFPTILCGDFNSNKRWDEWDRWWNHSDVVRELEEIEILSLYHTLKGEQQGQEKEPTLFLQRNIEKAYHIDYAFIPRALYGDRTNISIGKPEHWLDFSDHMPVFFEI